MSWKGSCGASSCSRTTITAGMLWRRFIITQHVSSVAEHLRQGIHFENTEALVPILDTDRPIQTTARRDHGSRVARHWRCNRQASGCGQSTRGHHVCERRQRGICRGSGDQTQGRRESTESEIKHCSVITNGIHMQIPESGAWPWWCCVSRSIIFSCSTIEPGHPCVTISGNAFSCFERT